MNRIKPIGTKVKCCIAAVMRRLRFYRRLEPVVAFTQDGELMYGRFDYYDDDDIDNPYIVMNESTGLDISCFCIRRISEKIYAMHTGANVS